MSVDFSLFGLGRYEPSDLDHIDKYPFSTVMDAAPVRVEKLLLLPTWHKKHNQGREGACVGFAVSMMLAILNQAQCRREGADNPYVRYNPWWLWDRAKEIDPWSDTNPGDQNGTTVRAACEVLRTRGHVYWPDENSNAACGPEQQEAGIATYRWASGVDEGRAAIAADLPIAMGSKWFTGFDKPTYHNGEWWIGKEGSNLGYMRGGHAYCVYGASDERQAFRIKNSWGGEYPEVWMPYKTADFLIRENGEFALVTDR